MRSLDVLTSAFSSIRSNPVRSFLTSLGVTAGVTAVVALVGLLWGIGGFVQNEFEGMLNSNAFEITRRNPDFSDSEGRNKSRSWPSITAENGEDLAFYTDSLCTVAWEGTASGAVVFQSSTALDVTIYGCSDQSQIVNGTVVEYGRYFTEEESDARSRVCVLGADLAETLGITEADLGSAVKIAGHRFNISGIEEASGSAFGVSMDNNVRIPYSTFQSLFSRPGSEVVVTVMPLEGVTLEKALEESVSVMRNLRGLTSDDDSNFYAVTQEGSLSSINELLTAVGAITIGIAAISLLVGGIGIMNITLVSVAERTREVGTRRALGATRLDVVRQFLSEAVAVSLLGGLTGLALGTGIISIVSALTPVPAILSPWSAVAALGFSWAVGLIFGVYPAWKAAGLSPVEALRYE